MEAVGRQARPWAVAIGVVLLTGCAEGDFLDPDPPTREPDVTEPLSRPLSVMDVPMRIPVAPLLELVEDVVPRTYGDLEEFHPLPDDSQTTVAFRLERAPFSASFVGDVARLSAIVVYRLRVNRALRALPDVETSCGFGDGPRPALVVEVESPMSLDRDWSLRSSARVVEVRPASSTDVDRCEVTALRIDITDRLMESARSLLEDHMAEIDSLVGAVDTRSRFASWWNTLQTPIQLADSLWLAIRPEAIQRGPLRGSGDAVTVELALRSRPEVVVGARPPPRPLPLPPLDSGLVEPSLDLLVEARAEYDAVSRLLTDRLAGRDVPMGDRRIRVDSVGLYGIGGGSVAMDLWISGDLNGHLYLTGRPAIDVATGDVSIPDLDLDVSTRDVILRAATWFSQRSLREYLREHATWPTDAAVEWLTMWLERGLNRRISDDLSVSGQVDTLEIVGAAARRDAFWVRVSARGSASMLVDD